MLTHKMTNEKQTDLTFYEEQSEKTNFCSDHLINEDVPVGPNAKPKDCFHRCSSNSFSGGKRSRSNGQCIRYYLQQSRH